MHYSSLAVPCTIICLFANTVCVCVDARNYCESKPCIMHPPCEMWGNLVYRWHGAHKIGADGGCFESALHTLYTSGGVIEHPITSKAISIFDLPRPPCYCRHMARIKIRRLFSAGLSKCIWPQSNQRNVVILQCKPRACVGGLAP